MTVCESIDGPPRGAAAHSRWMRDQQKDSARRPVKPKQQKPKKSASKKGGA